VDAAAKVPFTHTLVSAALVAAMLACAKALANGGWCVRAAYPR